MKSIANTDDPPPSTQQPEELIESENVTNDALPI